MAALAEQIAATNHELDFSVASLRVLERIVDAAEARCSIETTRLWGAYLGETIRRRDVASVTWVDRATAAAANTMVAELEPGYDIEAILRVGPTGYWFPLAKVEKFQRNGTVDSLAAFASVVIATLAPPAERKPVSDENMQRVTSALAALRTNRSVASLAQLYGAFFGTIPWNDYAEVLRAIGLGVDDLAMFLVEAPSGRGYKRLDPGHMAGALIAHLVESNLAPRDAILARARTEIGGASKVGRENGAYVLAYCELRAGRHDAFLELAAVDQKRREVAAGAWRALGSVTSNWRSKRYAQNIAMEPLVPIVTHALKPKSPLLALALDALNDWQFDWERRRDLRAILGSLVALVDHDKPSVAGAATRYVTSYLWAIVHGHAPPDPAVDALRKRGDKLGAEPLARMSAAE